jgi:hypothetical protein
VSHAEYTNGTPLIGCLVRCESALKGDCNHHPTAIIQRSCHNQRSICIIHSYAFSMSIALLSMEANVPLLLSIDLRTTQINNGSIILLSPVRSFKRVDSPCEKTSLPTKRSPIHTSPSSYQGIDFALSKIRIIIVSSTINITRC